MWPYSKIRFFKLCIMMGTNLSLLFPYKNVVIYIIIISTVQKYVKKSFLFKIVIGYFNFKQF